MLDLIFPDFVHFCDEWLFRKDFRVSWIAEGIFGVSFFFGVIAALLGRSDLRIALLSAIGLSFVAGHYNNEQYPNFSYWCLIAGHILFLLYLLWFKLAQDKKRISTKTSHWLAALIILISFAVKLYELRDWPPVLTDYAAMTGLDGIRVEDGATTVWSGRKTFLQSGGTSPIHAPTLLASYKLFGHTSEAVRFAEVIGSIFTLLFFWLCVSELIPKSWALIALLCFAFSADHLSNARVGTFYSISQALALCVLWTWIKISKPGKHSAWIWALIAISTALLPYAYAPIRTLYLFIGIMCGHLVYLKRHHPYFKQALSILLVVVFSALAIQFLWKGSIHNFYTPPASLATDTTIWHKTDAGKVTASLQPISTIAVNLWSNIKVSCHEIYHHLFSEVFYASGFTLVVLFSIFGLFTRAWWIPSCYTLVGILPMILIFPVVRRGYTMLPLEYLPWILFIREYYVAFSRTSCNILLQRSIQVLCGLLILSLPFSGIYFFAKYNGTAGVGPSFGTIYTRPMIDKVKTLVDDYQIIFVDQGLSTPQFQMGLIDELKKSWEKNTKGIKFLAINKKKELLSQFDSNKPTCFAILHEGSREWIPGWVNEQLPGVQIVPEKNPSKNELMYTLIYYRPSTLPFD